MIREVNLLDYLPKHVQEFREIQHIMNAEEPELQLIEDTSEVVKDNMFILHTNEDGIARYEKMFGLTPSEGDSLHDRQSRVLSQYTNSVIYTMRGLIERLDIVCGVNNYTIEMFPGEYRIQIKLLLRVNNLVNVISSALGDMIPANMICEYILNHNTHDALSMYPEYILMQFTHREVCDANIDECISASCENIANYTVNNFESITCEHILNFGMRKV